MTLGGSSNQSDSVMLAYNKRKAQLDRWRESETEKESVEIRNRPKRVKFADKCIFQAACAANDKNQVARMIQDGYDINDVDEDGITALHQACIEDNIDMVEFLLKHGADVNISDNEGWTPLHAVATCCYVSIAKLLLEHGADVVALNNDCSIPLDICKSDAIREIFIQDINAKGIDLKEARRGEELRMIEDAKKWLRDGYTEKPNSSTGATALHVAACKGYIKVIDLLIKSGANVNAQDFDGWTPLHAAAHWSQKEACELLLENNCDTTIKNNCNQTAIDVADSSVLIAFDNYKKKKDLPKPDKTVPALPLEAPVQTKKAPVKEETTKPTGNSSTKVLTSEAQVNSETNFDKSSVNEVGSFDDITPIPALPTSSTESTSVNPTPVDEQAKFDVTPSDNTASWRRTSSLRSRAPAVTDDAVKPPEKVVKKPKSDIVNDTSLRRAYSFESDPKFYSRLRDARNRIKAGNSNSSAPSVPILENPVTSGGDNENLISSLTNFNETQTKSNNAISTTKPPSALTTSKLEDSYDESSFRRLASKRSKESELSKSTTGSPKVQTRSVGSQDVKVRSSDGNILYGGAKIPGPVSKFKQFLFKSFVPPTRDEESETQRKAHAKRVRETRRSTQGVTLEELKSAEQYVKNNLLGNSAAPEQSTVQASIQVPANVLSKKEDDTNVERRPSWRLRVDETDPSKFSLEDTRNTPQGSTKSSTDSVSTSAIVHRSSSLRNKNNKVEQNLHGKPPKPPDDSDVNKTPVEDDKEKDMKNSGAQGAILRKKKTKRRSTGIVQYSPDGSDLSQGISGSDVEVGSGSGPSSDFDQEQDSKNENGVSSSSINYRKLYEEVLKENQSLKHRLGKAEEDIADLRLKLDRVSLTPRISSDDLDRREKRLLERKLSEMEEELKESRLLRTENQKLRDENGALIRVISKLSK